MNYMKQVAKMLGVELGERFKISIGDEVLVDDYCFMDDGLQYHNVDRGLTEATYCMLHKLICGEYEIVKKPWKPKDGERFWYVSIIGGEEVCYESDIFDDLSIVDVMFLAFGNCFRTKDEAKEHKDEMLAKMREVLER